MKALKYWFALVVLLGLWVAHPEAVRADGEWIRNAKPADYPATVKSINFSNGNNLYRGHQVAWGQWKVRFSTEPPVATFLYQ